MFKSKQTKAKQLLAEAAMEYIKGHSIIGVGTGSTANAFIEQLAKHKSQLEGAVASSLATEKLLKQHGIQVLDLNTVGELPVYIDGADVFVDHGYLLKGGGGALTREKICAAAAKQFVCLADGSKQKNILKDFPVVIEVIPMARSLVARKIVEMGGAPEYRAGYKTDNGNIILDVFNLDLVDPIKIEADINNIPGVVANGIFGKQSANVILTTDNNKLITIHC